MSNQLPKGWLSGCLEDIVETISSGVSVNSEGREKNAGEIGILKTSCVTTGSFRPTEHKAVISSELGRVAEPVEGDSIIVSRMNTPDLVGASAYVDRSYSDLFLPDRLWQVRPSNKVVGRWLGFVIGSPAMRVRLKSIASGTSDSMKNISQDSFLGLPVKIPPLDEQQHIVSVLGAWDNHLKIIDPLIELQRKRLGALSTRLIWADQDEWRPLSDYLEPSRDRVGADRSLEVYSVTREGLRPQLEQFSKRIANEDIARHMLLRPNEFALSGLNFWLGSVAVSHLEYDVCISPDYKVFRFKSSAAPDYFRHLVRTDGFREILRSCSTERASVVRKNFNRDIFLESEVPVPPLAEQERRAKVLNAIAFELRKTERYRSLLENQNRGLMQKLLTGEWQLGEHFDPVPAPHPLHAGDAV